MSSLDPRLPLALAFSVSARGGSLGSRLGNDTSVNLPTYYTYLFCDIII